LILCNDYQIKKDNAFAQSCDRLLFNLKFPIGINEGEMSASKNKTLWFFIISYPFSTISRVVLFFSEKDDQTTQTGGFSLSAPRQVL